MPKIAVLPGFSADVTTEAELPDFTAFGSVAEKKAAFIDFILPLVEQENEKIRQQRSQLEFLSVKLRSSQSLSRAEQLVVSALCDEYGVEYAGIVDARLLDRLLKRVDVIPPSLVLSQAATESGWGTSRLAVKKNNLFGHFGFADPADHKGRVASRHYRPVEFESPSHAVARYFKNLNTHDAYREFRELRADLRGSNKAVTGLALVSELLAYSSRGRDYVQQIAQVIRVNGLSDFDDSTRYL